MPIDHAARFMHITGTSIPKVLGTHRWSPPDQHDELALRDITGLSDLQGNIHTENGHKDEPLAAEWYRQQRGLTVEEVVSAPFKVCPGLPFLGATVDRLVNPQTADGGRPGIAEMKYWSGNRNAWKVQLRGLCPKEYQDQCYLQMLVWEREYCDLVISSGVNRDWSRLPWKPAWWSKDAVKKIRRFYELYMRWYWEDDATRTDAIRPYLEKFYGGDQAKVNEFLARRPPNAHEIAYMKGLRRGVKV